MTMENLNKAALKIMVIDSHEIFLHATIEVLSQQYPNAEIISVKTVQTALQQLEIFVPHLIVMELTLPQKPGQTVQTDNGIQLLTCLIQNYPNLNIFIHSDKIKTLIRIKLEQINTHQGGFVIADKHLNCQEIIQRISWAIQGLTYTKNLTRIPPGVEINSIWLNVLHLAFQEGLQDKAIAQRIFVSERTVRHYWDKLQSALGIDSEELKNQGKNIRIHTGILAREVGLID